MLIGWILGIGFVLGGVLLGTPTPWSRRAALAGLGASAFPVAWVVLHGAGAIVPGPAWLGSALLSVGLHGVAATAGAWIGQLLAMPAPEPAPRVAVAQETLPPPPPPLAVGDPLAEEAASGQAGLLRVLRDGPDFHRAAAARALAIPFAGSRQKALGEALLGVLDGDADDEARAEAAIALSLVFALELDADAHREGLPIPVGWIDAAREAVARGG